MSQINSIEDAADKARSELAEKLGGESAAVALALALGQLCADARIPLGEAIALLEVAHRAAKPEAASVAA